MERDPSVLNTCIVFLNFNSHAHVERDCFHVLITSIAAISTHTLTWSVTIYNDIRRGTIKNFNSHAHVERDRPLYYKYFDSFISTHTLTWSVTKFDKDLAKMLMISTHTLTWSVTCYTFHNHTRQQYFNSHAHVERDKVAMFLKIQFLEFQLTRSRGA